jgi:hypothetical protein
MRWSEIVRERRDYNRCVPRARSLSFVSLAPKVKMQ